MARYQPGSDATAARKLARSEPLSGRNTRSDETPRRSSIERLKPGDDPTNAINRLYSEGRRYPHGTPHDASRETTEAVVLPCDEGRLRQVWQDFNSIVDDIKARSAKPITPRPDPAQIERKKLVAERQKQFGGNGRQR